LTVKCPECGSNRVRSKGDYWKCTRCGRTFLKHYRGRKTVYRSDVSCPECGSHRIVSKGTYWLCAECGRWFKKIYRKPVYRGVLEIWST